MKNLKTLYDLMVEKSMNEFHMSSNKTGDEIKGL